MRGPSDGTSTLTKAEIAERLHNRLGISRLDAHEMVDQVIDAMMEALTDPLDGALKLARFGNLLVRRKAARMGRNPATDERMLLERRRVVVFRPSAILKKAMNRRTRP